MLLITPDVRDLMFAHALAELPLEACGMFSRHAASDLVDAFHPMRNAAESSTLFALDGQELLDLERAADNTGREVVGVMHSHTETSPYPSPTDVRDSGRFDPMGTYRHVIVSLRQGEPALRCFTITGEDIVELPVVVTSGDEDEYDSGGAAAVAAVVPIARDPQS